MIEKGSLVEFTADPNLLHSLLFEDDGTLGITLDSGQSVSIAVQEIYPLDKETNKITVVAEVLEILDDI
jgi:hypothetical protein